MTAAANARHHLLPFLLALLCWQTWPGPASLARGATPAAANAPVAAKLVLADGSVLEGVLVDSDADSVTFRARGPAQQYALSSVRVLSFAAADDYWLDRPRVAAQGQTLVLRSGKTARGELESVTSGGIVWRLERSRKRVRYPLDGVKRVYLNPRGFDFGFGPGESGSSAAVLRFDPRSRELLLSAIAEARRLRQRLASTAHQGEPFEQQAMASLAGLETAAMDLDRLLAAPAPEPDPVFRATELLLGREAEVDHAMDALVAYESVRASWVELSDVVLTEVVDEVKRALRGPRG